MSASLPKHYQKHRNQNIPGQYKGIHIRRYAKPLTGKIHHAVKDQHRKDAALGSIIDLHYQQGLAHDHGQPPVKRRIGQAHWWSLESDLDTMTPFLANDLSPP